ncbi:probable G-protein coupled receptor B0563.6 [Paramacrobiotus metropolitanus]|uniref:probable G-protein coupled receptor B0563.6 n=1 Tax=Paramacrobiotus metropolitanus TaxID=2943436 RepID=UPI002446555F|nr:probable G-protein coupled receptor B0563.6 [Paramacrobiotus metropolitanus]XP_055349391.1 probable G-protein coupled receptor B0563.6 [Paramacrobiotus metropolitanus]
MTNNTTHAYHGYFVTPQGVFGGIAVPKYYTWELREDDCHRVHNVTNQIVPTVYIAVVMIPVFLAMCTVGNILNLWILIHHCQKGVKQVFLLGMAISDMTIMWLSFLRYLILYSNILGIFLPDHPLLLGSYGALTWLQYAVCYVTDWILIFFSLERLIAFRFPHRHDKVRKKRSGTVWLLVGFVTTSLVITCGILVWFYHWWWYHEDKGVYVQPEWVITWIRNQQRVNIIFPILVSISLLITNAWLLDYLKKQLNAGRNLQAVSFMSRTGDFFRSHTRRHDNLTRMLIGCVMVYFITQIPAVIHNTLDHLSHAPYCWFDLTGLHYVDPVISTLALLNYSVNFLVYCGASHKYRQLFYHVIRQGSMVIIRKSRGPPGRIPQSPSMLFSPRRDTLRRVSRLSQAGHSDLDGPPSVLLSSVPSRRASVDPTPLGSATVNASGQNGDGIVGLHPLYSPRRSSVPPYNPAQSPNLLNTRSFRNRIQ